MVRCRAGRVAENGESASISKVLSIEKSMLNAKSWMIPCCEEFVELGRGATHDSKTLNRQSAEWRTGELE
jgi:hypothetical protein